jgi:hypothetical protein
VGDTAAHRAAFRADNVAWMKMYGFKMGSCDEE